MLPTPNDIFERTALIRIQPTYTIRKLMRGIIGPPVSVLNYFDEAASIELQRLVRETRFDVVQIEGVHLTKYLPFIRGSRFRPLLLCDWHNIYSELVRRYGEHNASGLRRRYAFRTAHLLEETELRLLSECDAHISVSDLDRLKLQQRAPSARVYVVENGVDVELYADDKFEHTSQNGSDYNAARNALVFVGSMDYHPNIDAVRYFANEVWPRIQIQAPQLSFWIVGSKPTTSVRDLNKIKGITVTGTVSDVRPYYRKALAAVVPLRVGGGSRLKILEAMAAGVPVISTTIGAEGLRAIPGVHLVIADTPEEMFRSVMQLANSRNIWEALVKAGSELVRAGYDWCVVGSRLYEIHKSLVEKRQD
jgi:glycosyltransferase involved in cell wall biosynthesis